MKRLLTYIRQTFTEDISFTFLSAGLLATMRLTHLPFAYTWDKFDYRLTSDNDYDLDIPVHIMDRWHWDKEKQAFVYSDF